jgi:hypothetical protein
MSFREKYRKHREWGQSVFVSFTLSMHPVLWFGTAAAIGFVIGWRLV